ncbi:MAG: 4Fe-4S binding protein [Clostridiales bacterium]|nr:4Fe-4S binding protein [Clostridiales bacterium]
MASKNYAQVDRTRCVACGACRKVCPKSAVSVWRGCYAAVDENACVGCGLCSKTCPAGCIDLKERIHS